jgi:hypothetical protein
MNYARVVNGLVVELFTPPDEIPIEDCFHPEIAAQFVPVPDGLAVEQGWTYDGTAFAAPVPVPPTADEVYGEKIAEGLAVTSTATPALDATYPLMPNDFGLLGSIARDAASGLGLPGGGATAPIKDIDGTPHDFPEADVIALYKAERDYIAALAAQRDIMAGGGTPAWPPATATIP